MTYSVVNHVLHKDGKPVAQKPSPNHGGVMQPKILVLHYTAIDSASSAIATLTDGDASNRVSVHLVLDKDGAATQLLPLNVVGWHVGKSAYHGQNGCNNFAIGIEQVNAGVLNKMADGTFRTQLGKHPVPASEVLHAQHRITHGWAYWADYPDEQVQAAIEIGAALHAAYKLTDVVGHEDVATPPGRKVDPGPAYPLDTVRTRILGREE
jgi:N-acetylmuramoyl-L-alanine amidase